MKLMVFGSVNIDHTYHLPHLVREGETLSSASYEKNVGGKGFNQAIALAKAGHEVYFAGAVGTDGQFLREYMIGSHIHTDDLETLDVPTGHAIIQVDEEGRNSIILFGGANQAITRKAISRALSHLAQGDTLLLQNEISHGDEILIQAKQRGIHVVLNPSPVSKELLSWPLEYVDMFILNEVEGKDITGQEEPKAIVKALLARYPSCRIVLTLGEKGSMYADLNTCIQQEMIPTKAVDTTAAGDTFTGYFLHKLLAGADVKQALRTAAQAASIAVGRAGAAASIPTQDEVEEALRNR